jgi:putative mRNA 3-end processing factor
LITPSLHIPSARISLDSVHAEAEFAVISHAHSDHAPRSKAIPVITTPLTATLLRIRGFGGEILELPFYESLELPHCRLTLFPAGHIAGSAMIFVEAEQGNLLYTGDFRNPPSPTTEGFALPEKRVDYLVSEATFSLPIYRWADRPALTAQVQRFVQRSLEEEFTPVFLAYSLGKTQELLHALAPLALTTQVHTSAFALSEAVAAAGFPLGSFERFRKETLAGKPLIVPGGSSLPDLPKMRTAYVSGWAAHEAVRQQSGVDERIVLSDHADFFAVLELVRTLAPKQTWITHAPYPEVVCRWLQKEGFRADPLGNRREQGAE